MHAGRQILKAAGATTANITQAIEQMRGR
ncbi:Clp protease N-terminal domain-containing protein [Escherichia coli]